MGLRFRQRIKLMPGLTLNLGKKSMSLSAGVRGASITKGTQGTHANVGLPGTGLSYRTKIGGSSNEEEKEELATYGDFSYTALSESTVGPQVPVTSPLWKRILKKFCWSALVIVVTTLITGFIVTDSPLGGGVGVISTWILGTFALVVWVWVKK